MPRPTPSSALSILGMILTTLVWTSAWAGVAAAQDAAEPTPSSGLVISESDADPAIAPDSPVGDIIPRPNSGARPENPGDRGGSLQLGLFALLLIFFAVAAWRITVTGRAGRKAYATRAAAVGHHDDAAAPTARDDAVTDDGSAVPPRGG